MNDVVEITKELVKIKSENGIVGEDRVLDKILEQFIGMDGKIYRKNVSEGRTNALVVFEPHAQSKLIMFSGHMDTVYGYEENHSSEPMIKENLLYGRGTSDMKGALAAAICATKKFLEENTSLYEQNKGIVLAFTIDEENGCNGIQHMNSEEFLSVLSRVEFCILGEPTNCWPVYGHKGIVWYNIEYSGVAAHASVPHLGENAIYKASEFIQKIGDYKVELSKIKTAIGSPTVSVGTISGGQATNIIPNSCKITIDRRFVMNEDQNEDELKIKEIAEKIDKNVIFTKNPPGFPYSLPDQENNKIYQKIRKICEENKIKKSECILTGYTEADLYFRMYNIPTIILGPGSIEQAHQTPEYVEISQLIQSKIIYRDIIENFSNNLL